MCGRYTNQYTWAELHALYSLPFGTPPQSNFPPRYNIAPTQLSWIVREADGQRELMELRWGLLPHWAKKPGDGATTSFPFKEQTPFVQSYETKRQGWHRCTARHLPALGIAISFVPLHLNYPGLPNFWLFFNRRASSPRSITGE